MTPPKVLSGKTTARREGTFDLFGIFGYPLSHTLSPAMHEAAFSELGIEAYYLVLELDPPAFRRCLSRRSGNLLSGFNITVPYKETVLRFLDEVRPEARAIGAVNTVFRRGKKWVGTNTDVEGFLLSLLRDGKFRARGKRALVLGAGGAARALVYGLSRQGAERVWITDCVPGKAVKIVRDMKKIFRRVSYRALAAGSLNVKEGIKEADIIINATPLGLKPRDPRVVPGSWVPSGRAGRKLFMDLIYNPEETPFLKVARRRGHRTLNGLGMLLYQGARAFEYWTQRPAPVAVMRQALFQALERKKEAWTRRS
ncbi:MAG: shikimate dehydrogenase [Candidatus Omnitrophica bacterium]|nr:shikimate dehydrogenase [Candidatus Omnitrophota bacterium]